MEDFTFSRFAQTPEYLQVNTNLVNQVYGLQNARTILDIGAGTGVITKQIAECARPESFIIAIEPDPLQIEKAKAYLDLLCERVQFIRAREKDILPILASGFADVIFFCNAIHLLNNDDKITALREIYRLLAPGGYLVINSAFCAESVPKHTIKYYISLLRRARELIIKSNGAGEANEKAPVRKPLSCEEYKNLLKCAGFELVTAYLEDLLLSRQGVEAICQYWLFLEGSFPGVPYKESSQVLLSAIGEVFPQWPEDWSRMWLQIIAQKPL